VTVSTFLYTLWVIIEYFELISVVPWLLIVILFQFLKNRICMTGVELIVDTDCSCDAYGYCPGLII
jgi:hypothetical protein